MTQQSAQLPGGCLAYSVAGAGPAVILVHGLGGTRNTWRHLIGPLSLDHTVVAVDLPGHGESDPSAGGYSPGAHASALRDLLVSLKIPSATLVGHSLGGGIAIQFAYQYPEMTSGLGLISSAGFGADVTPVLRAALIPGVETALWALGHLPALVTRTSMTVMSVVTGLGSAADAGPVSEDLLGMTDHRRRHGFVRTARAGLDRHGQSLLATPYLTHLDRLPMLLAWGSRDQVIPPSHFAELAATLPQGLAVEIEDAGHYPQDTHADRILEPLLHFLSSTAALENEGVARPSGTP